jgi:hypothetical protein
MTIPRPAITNKAASLSTPNLIPKDCVLLVGDPLAVFTVVVGVEVVFPPVEKHQKVS